MLKLPHKLKRTQNATAEELLTYDKNVLVEKILQLEAHNKQLKNIISKNVLGAPEHAEKRPKKEFDFSKCHFRKLLLHIMYFGWNYQGLAVQEDTNQTIEHHLFSALRKACLIESRETSNYHRCGRTDKGVSAFGQVISISLRSNIPPELQHDPQSIQKEINYCKILNRLLPKEIRAVAWMPIPLEKPEYSARFDCTSRTYKYFFPRSALNIDAMQRACSKMVGNHDFRNLCKMDVGNGVVEFRRSILNADVLACDENDKNKATSMHYLEIKGNAFLWHQIRCIMGVLLLIGEGKETEDVIDQLLDVGTNDRKPHYNMALDVPLNLYRCSYDLENTSQWIYDKENLKTLIKHLQGEWTIHSIKTAMLKDSLQQLGKQYSLLASASGMEDERDETITAHTDCLLQGVKPKVYTALMKRQTCSSLDERIQHYTKKRKPELCVDQEDENKK